MLSHQDEQYAGPIKLNNTVRDALQSNMGTNPTSDEMLEMLTCIEDAAYNSNQIGGGTFFNLIMDKGRDAWGENDQTFKRFEKLASNILVRDDFLVGYDRNHQTVIDAFIEEFAELGLKDVINFHGLNDVRMQEGTFKAVKKAQENGHDIHAVKTICIEDNPNLSVESCMASLRQQQSLFDEIGLKDRGIYLKNANGKVEPEFIRELFERIADEFSGERVTFHTHNNQGLAYATSEAAIVASTDHNIDLALDVVPHPLAEGTGQQSDVRTKQLIDNHYDERVQARSPEADPEAMRPDYEKMYETRLAFRDKETRYSKKLWDALYDTGMAGGATSTVKGIPGMLENVMTAVGTRDEEEALIAVCRAEEEASQKLGDPTKVTPYQKMMTETAVFDLLEAKGITAYPQNPAKAYMLGAWGAVPASASKAMIRQFDGEDKAAGGAGYSNDLLSADQLGHSLDEIRQKFHVTTREAIVLSMTKSGDIMMRGAKHLDALNSAELKRDPKTMPSLPEYLTPPTPDHSFSPYSSLQKYDIAMALGGAPALEEFAQDVLEIEKSVDGFYKTEIGAGSVYARDRASRGLGMPEREESKQYLRQLYEGWANDAREKAKNFTASIDQKFTDYGFTPSQKLGAVFSANQVLGDVVDAKAKNASKRSLPALQAGQISMKYNGNASDLKVPDRRAKAQMSDLQLNTLQNT